MGRATTVWILDAEKLQRFFDGIAKGFERSPLYVVAFCVAFLVVTGGPLLLSAAALRRRAARGRAAALSRFEKAVAAKGLAPAEEAALMQMAAKWHPDPAQWLAVLERPSAFNAAAARSGMDPRLLARLRFKLGLREAGIRARLHSTAELERGVPVVLLSGTWSGPGRVRSVSPDDLVIAVGAVPAGLTEVTLRVPLPSGIHEAVCQVLGSETGSVRLAHAEVGAFYQNRRYVRRRVQATAVVRMASGLALPARVVDISGGGARLEIGGSGAKPGDVVTLVLTRSDGGGEELPGRVVRLHAGGFSIVFEGISERQRDQLIRGLGSETP